MYHLFYALLFGLAHFISQSTFAFNKDSPQTSEVQKIEFQRKFPQYKEGFVSVSNKNWSFERKTFEIILEAERSFNYENLFESERLLLEGFRYLKNLPYNDFVRALKFQAYLILGKIKYKQFEYHTCLDHFNKALSYAHRKKDSALLLNEVSVVYAALDKYKIAHSKSVAASQIFRKFKDSTHLAQSLVNLAEINYKSNKPKVLDLLYESIQIQKKIKDIKLLNSYQLLSNYYNTINQSDSATYYAKLAVDLSLERGNRSEKISALQNLIELGEIDISDYYFELLEKTDSTFLVNNANNSKVLYEFEKNKETIHMFEAMTSDLRRENVIYQSLTTFCFLFVLTGIPLLRRQYRKKKIIHQFEIENRISKKLHDEVANDIFLTISQIQNNRLFKYQLLNALEDIYFKTRSISNAHADINIIQNYESQLEELIQSYKSKELNIVINNLHKIPWQVISKYKKKLLYRTVQELMTNMKKHSRANLVTFDFNIKYNKLVVTYIDNGVGAETMEGNGLQNLIDRVSMVGGDVKFESKINNGFKVFLSL